MVTKKATYELYYSTGGHGGPYPSLRAARSKAKQLLKGNINERYIKIKNNKTGKFVATVWKG